MCDAVGPRPAAFVAGAAAIVRILVAKAEHRPAGNGNERRHRHHHDGGEPPRPLADAHDSHDANYTTNLVNGLSTSCRPCQRTSPWSCPSALAAAHAFCAARRPSMNARSSERLRSISSYRAHIHFCQLLLCIFYHIPVEGLENAALKASYQVFRCSRVTSLQVEQKRNRRVKRRSLFCCIEVVLTSP